MPFAPRSFLLLVLRPGAITSSVLASETPNDRPFRPRLADGIDVLHLLAAEDLGAAVPVTHHRGRIHPSTGHCV